MKSEITFIKKIQDLSVYRDPYMEENALLFGRKGKEVDPGLVWVPNENFKNIKGAPFEKEEVDKILKESVKNKKFSDYTFVICNISDDKLHLLEKFISEKLHNNQ